MCLLSEALKETQRGKISFHAKALSLTRRLIMLVVILGVPQGLTPIALSNPQQKTLTFTKIIRYSVLLAPHSWCSQGKRRCSCSLKG